MKQDTDFNYYNLPESNMTYDALLCDPRAKGLKPSAYDDLLKISAKKNVVVYSFDASSDGTHREDGVDIVNECENILLKQGTVQAGINGVAITNKGGNRNVTCQHLLIIPPYGRWCDIEDGNYADQSWRMTEETVYDDIIRQDGKPVRYAWGRAKRAKLLNGKYKIVWWWTAALHVYVYAKHWWVTRKSP